MAIAVVQRAVQATTTTTGTVSVAFGSNLTIGNTVIVVSVDGNSSVDMARPTDTLSNSYLPLFGEASTNDFASMRAWIVEGCKAGANTVTVTNTSFARMGLYAYEVSGLAATHAFDSYGVTKFSLSNTPSSGAVIPMSPNNLLLGVILNNATTAVTFTAGAGYSNLQQTTDAGSFNTAMEEQLITAGGSQTAGITLATNNGTTMILILVFSDIAVWRRLVTTNIRPRPFAPGLAR